MTAGAIFPDGSRSERYFRTGWRDFQSALKVQLLPDGEYVQYSANYHRFALQLVLWVNFLLQQRGMTWPMELILPLRRSIRKLSAEVDSWSGGANNVGHNDGALLFAFGSPFGDYRPTLQACARVFFGRPFFAPGPWDELGVWLRAQPLPESLIGVEFPVSYLDRTALRLKRTMIWLRFCVAITTAAFFFLSVRSHSWIFAWNISCESAVQASSMTIRVGGLYLPSTVASSRFSISRNRKRKIGMTSFLSRFQTRSSSKTVKFRYRMSLLSPSRSNPPGRSPV